MNIDSTTVWTVIAGLGIGSFLLRFSFLGVVGGRPLPEWLLRLLRYTPVAVLPALVAPAILWPQATGGAPDPARLIAAVATVAFGAITRNVPLSIFGGAGVLYLALYLIG